MFAPDIWSSVGVRAVEKEGAMEIHSHFLAFPHLAPGGARQGRAAVGGRASIIHGH